MPQSIKEILEEHRVEVREHGDHPHCTEGWVQTTCPLCTPHGGHFRLGFSLTSNACACWSCGRQSAGEMLGLLIGVPAKQAWAMIGKVERVGFKKKARGVCKLPSGSSPLTTPHRDYLKRRGICPQEAEEIWGLLGTTQASSRPWSLIFPVKQDWETVSFFSRKLHDRGGRYLSAEPQNEAVSAKELLWAEDFAVNAVCVCEGAFDAMRIGPGAVATMGISVTDAQVRRLTRFHRVVVAMDNEPAAQRRAENLCSRLGVFGIETINVTVSGKDVASKETPESEIKEIRRLLR